MSYGPDMAMRQSIESVVYVDKILRGARPADLPLEEPTKLELVTSLKPPSPRLSSAAKLLVTRFCPGRQKPVLTVRHALSWLRDVVPSYRTFYHEGLPR